MYGCGNRSPQNENQLNAARLPPVQFQYHYTRWAFSPHLVSMRTRSRDGDISIHTEPAEKNHVALCSEDVCPPILQLLEAQTLLADRNVEVK